MAPIRRGNRAIPLLRAPSPVSKLMRKYGRCGTHQLRQHARAVVRGVRAVIALRPVVLDETDHAQVLDAVPLDVADREDDDLRLP